MRYLTVAAGMLALVGQGLAQGCEGWNTSLFFLSATSAEVESCLAAGAEVNARATVLGHTPLHLAAQFNNNPAVIEVLLDAGADATARDLSDNTPWDYAKDRRELQGSDAYQRLSEVQELAADLESPSLCAEWSTQEFFESATLEIVESCLAAGVDVNAQVVSESDYWGPHTPLHFAAGYSANPAIITALLDAGADASAQTPRGITPLHFAAGSNDNPAIIESLVAAGAKVNARHWLDWIPLHSAAARNANPDIIEALLDAGADAGARDREDKTPWDYAHNNEALRGTDAYLRLAASLASAGCEVAWNTDAFFMFATPAEVRGCLAAGADVNTQDWRSNTPLHYAVRHSDNPTIIEVLLDAGAEVNARGVLGDTPLHDAASKGNLAIVEVLVAAGADVNARTRIDSSHSTPLHRAAGSSGNPAVIRTLVAAGADVNARSKYGGTPLHWAAQFSNDPTVIEVLLESGADADVLDTRGKTPWDYAQDNEALESSDAYRRLREGSRCAGWTTPKFFVSATLKKVRSCLAAGPDVNAWGRGGNTPLHLAVNHSDHAIVSVLLDAGADVNARTELGHTPLHLAARTGDSNTVLALVDAGANVDARDEDGNTPLHLTLTHRNLASALVLVAAGADVNARNGDGLTPLQRYTPFGSSPTVIAALLAAGADVNAQSKYGCTPLHDLAQRDNPAVVALLVYAGAQVNARCSVLWVSGRVDRGATPLHLAAGHSDNPAVVEVLLNAGTDASAWDYDGKTPWDYVQENEALRGTDAWWRLREGSIE